jgi:hypothetical protein
MHKRHRTFALTGPDYMEGKRVKPRLRNLAYATYLIVGVATFLFLIGLFVVLQGLGGLPGGLSGTVLLVLVLLTPHSLGYLIPIVLKSLFLRLGLLTLDEAVSFPPWCAWPENWLEPSTRQT